MMWHRIVPWLPLACLLFHHSSGCVPGSRSCENVNTSSLDAWICSLIGSLLVGLSGVFPLLVIPVEAGAALRSEEGARRLKQLLSFAIGGLGDVFVHLLPEAWAYTRNDRYVKIWAGEAVAWILPFTSGGFLYIALVNVLPDLLEEKNTRNSLVQVLLISCGIVVMTVLSLTVE
ncbi:LOW QUALITY PROTEIN: zinc transporter ZIP13 [Leptodactylus fuscus]